MPTCDKLCTRVHGTKGRLTVLAATGETRSMNTQRMQQLGNELRDLNAELMSLQARALDRVEELENNFYVAELPSDVKTLFRTMQRLITKV